MNNTTTHENLIKYVYRETTKTENQEVTLRRLIDSDFYNECYEMTIVKRELDHCLLSPNSTTVNAILSYAKIS